ncbi:hypothetical protein Cs7R123_11530 [Catellatospora sp. TT07R-123]|uniref:hypothetical protein n=1 Tax=Catellatospora sp. TT07R-123 TaxID=2733863 RepID=UPI001B040DFD|nr:hypothetical protein [Catellatospora sp. TT07R-123]GHJ43811.1 hypothetical protein Cs7R123_11530 [Catellatospora sp. TT07R-123]
MQISMATSAAPPDRVNEDFAAAVPGAAVLLDGAGIVGAEAICRHGVAWYTHRLGGALIHRLSLGDGRELAMLLAEAIAEVADSHRGTCDLAEPSSPSATVAMLRVRDGRADWLVLGDSILVLDRIGVAPLAVTDRREVEIATPLRRMLDALAPDTPEYTQARARAVGVMRASRNQPGGFFVAKDDPSAVAQAVAGSLPVTELAAAALLSNGASRLVDRYALADWTQLLALLAAHGPGGLIRQVRAAEPWPGESPDDATAAYCTGLTRG